MAYDRYNPEERRWRDEDDRRPSGRDRDRWNPDYDRNREDMNERGGQDRGFFNRMGDEMRSWFGSDDRGNDRSERERDEDRYRPSYGERDYNPQWRDELERRPNRMSREDRD